MAWVVIVLGFYVAAAVFGFSRVRAERARTDGVLDGLDVPDAHLVREAVRDGRQVVRPDLASATAAYARALVTDLERPWSWRRWSWPVAAAAAVALAAVSMLQEQRAAAIVWFALAAFAVTSPPRYRRRLIRAIEANGG